jgi:hypothetical protein
MIGQSLPGQVHIFLTFLAAFTAAPGFDAAAWLPGDVMACFFHTA